jgi:hypothetical protein
MKVYDEMIHNIEGVRLQCIKWKDMVWNIFCNDRFEPGDFTVKVHCEICGPEVFVPKVFEYRGHRICNSCLTRFSEMMQAATLADCGRDRQQTLMLKEAYKMIERRKKNGKKISIEGKKT